MSKHEEKRDDANCICPYCEYAYQVEDEDIDYSEADREEECEECGKKFYLASWASVTHCTTPDCELNGAAHDWQPVTLQINADGSPIKVHDFCAECDACRPTEARTTT